MDSTALRLLLEHLAAGEVSVDAVVEELRFLPYADLGFAKVDHHRELRLGFAEAVYGPGKSPDRVAAITAELVRVSSGAVLVTRATPDQFEAVAAAVPDASYHESARLIVARTGERAPEGVVAVVSAGTADEAVAEEAAVTAEAMGLKVERLADAGVAGLHRLVTARDLLDRSDVVIAVAGMEGALASLLAGLVQGPVIGVPTSVGYGAGAGGIAPLLTMLNSCAPGVGVVNIDNGFGAAVLAATILRRRRDPGGAGRG